MGDISNIEIGWRSALMLAVCSPLLMAALMLAFRRVERAANLWLAFFLLIAVIAQIPQIIGFSGFYTVWPGLTFAPFNVELYAGPLLYLHADRLMRGGKLEWRKLLLIPGLLQTAYYLWAFLGLGDYKSKWAYSERIHTPYIEPIETLIGIGLICFAIFAILRLMRRYRQFLENTQSAARDFDPIWLRRLLIAIIAAGLVVAGLELIPTFIRPISYVDAFPAQVILTMIVAWLGFEALAKTGVDFPKLPQAPQTADGQPAPVNDRDWSAEAKALKDAVKAGGWYLEPRLSIRDLAARMGSNETYISRTLNKGLGLSFNDFVNGLRIEKAKQLIAAGEVSMLEVAYASGFNSKATFNRVFRDMLNMTPSAYKTSQNP